MNSEIVEKIAKDVCEKSKFADVKVMETVKNNCETKTGLYVPADEGSYATAIVYIDDYVREWENGERMYGEMVDEIARILCHAPWQKWEPDNFSKEFILSHAYMQVVNADWNKDRLDDMPHKNFLDLAVCYRIRIEGGGTAAITNIVLSKLGITQEELEEAANSGMEREGYTVSTLFSLLDSMTPGAVEDRGAPLYIMTNKCKNHGASAMLDGKLLQDFADKVGDFYILPSSIHEVLAVPVDEVDSEFLRALVENINRNEVKREEWLSNNIYRYDHETGELKIA